MSEHETHLLVKRGWYYRPDSQGYTGAKCEAGRYPKERAEPDAGVTAIHERDAPEFAPGCGYGTRLEIQARLLRKQVKELGAEPVI